MSENIFLFCAYCRSNDGLADKKIKADNILKRAKAYLKEMDNLKELKTKSKESKDRIGKNTFYTMQGNPS